MKKKDVYEEMLGIVLAHMINLFSTGNEWKDEAIKTRKFHFKLTKYLGGKCGMTEDEVRNNMVYLARKYYKESKFFKEDK